MGAKYGEEKARQLMEVVSHMADHYTHGVLIDFDFTRALRLPEQVQAVCQQRGWQFEQVEGDLRLLQRGWMVSGSEELCRRRTAAPG